ncbi:hypothetical protein SAMN05421806_13618 [Streptomyces indicus]|uniref:Uncharacterized protein n=1 Tax=Streptomyces indicus TaxID=417292 RepID=A0A1G9JV55_9ACTN|nr:hypothetical protein SAMN05421806_13618 [Streptomyces indicus]
MLLAVLGLLVLLVVWVVTSGGGGAGGKGADGKNPAPSITPGPSGSGPAISEQPGGRDESGDDGGASSGEDGGGDSSGSGSGSGADGGGSGEGSGGTAAGSGSGGNAGSSSGEQLPAGSPLPNCRATDLELAVESEKNRYEPGEKPKVEIVAKNKASADCKVDLGPKELVITITKAGDDDPYWKSSHCPATAGSLLYRLPGNSAITYTLNWDRRPSAPDCASPAPGSASAGTYLVEAKGEGTGTLRASFVLEEA